ncbi:pilus assembly protein PilS [Neisseria meningitidis]|nr:pilus assembly protein PilS [Neisseria meningitidis]RNJ80907.1 pilus assembly protein PilS [Neisseria meningitidis]
MGSSFPRRRESRPVGAETYRITRFPQPCILDSHFRGNDGGAVSAFSNKCPPN